MIANLHSSRHSSRHLEAVPLHLADAGMGPGLGDRPLIAAGGERVPDRDRTRAITLRGRATTQHLPVTVLRHPFDTRKMALERPAGAIGFTVRIKVQNYSCNFTPVRALCVRVEQAQIVTVCCSS